MRIIIDLQGAQTGSRFRGIGRYVTALTQAMIKQGRDHEYLLLLNGAFPDSVEQIRAAFQGLLPSKNIVVWHPAGEPEAFDQPGQNVRVASQVIREYMLQVLEPDVVIVSSIFEGLGAPAVVTVKEYLQSIPTVAIFHDFTPLLMPSREFKWNMFYRAWYRHRVEQLKRCNFIFTNSESSRKELHHFLDFPEDRSVNIFGGRSGDFKVRTYEADERKKILERARINRPFLLFAGGLEENKNLRGLIESLALLPAEIKSSYELVIVGRRNAGEEEEIYNLAKDESSRKMLNVVGYVSDDELIDLYNLCSLFVCPSLREGFGLPVAEAMACGAPVIVSNRTSLPELVSDPRAQFDPQSPREIAATIKSVLTHQTLRHQLVEYGLERATELTWDNSAKALLSSLEQQFKPGRSYDLARRCNVVRTSQLVDAPPRIVVMKLDHNGDFLLSIPALTKLCARYPHSRIDAIVGSWNRAAAEALGMFSHIYTLDYFKAKSSERASLEAEVLGELLAQLPYYDYAVDLRRQSESRFLLVQIPAGKYFGYASGEEHIDRLLTNTLPRFPEPGGHFTQFDCQHTSDQLVRIVDLLPHATTDYLGVPPAGPDRVVAPGTIAIFPRVGNDSRQWDSDRFGELIDRLAANPEVKAINLYAGNAAELEPIPFRPDEKIAVHAGYRYPDLLASLAGNQVCIGNNSFGVHLGSYAGCTTIGIYSGHERPEQWGPPFGQSWVITADAPCSPCHLPDRPSCPFDLFCLRHITVDTVERVVLDALTGNGVHEDLAKISSQNPSSAIMPMMHTLATARYQGKIHELNDRQRTALAAAIATNFPDRPGAEQTVYIDVSVLAESNGHHPSRTSAKLNALKAVAEKVSRTDSIRRRVVWVSSGPHDHEIYAIDTEDLLHLDATLLRGDRRNRIVLPRAGDVYFAPDVTITRNPAQWDLIASWRLLGVRVVMAGPDATTDAEGDLPEAAADYLFKIAHFDAVAVPPAQLDTVKGWLNHYGPPRFAPLQLMSGGDLSVLAADPGFVHALLETDGSQKPTQQLA